MGERRCPVIGGPANGRRLAIADRCRFLEVPVAHPWGVRAHRYELWNFDIEGDRGVALVSQHLANRPVRNWPSWAKVAVHRLDPEP